METISFQSHSILVAEDNDDNFEYIWHTLKNTGVNILRAKDGREAVSIVKENPAIDLILMDGMMPEMTGYEAAIEIKQMRSDLPIVILTAFVDHSSIREAVMSGCNDYLAKPIGVEELKATLSKWLVK